MLHLERKHDGVDVFAAEGGVVHERRKRVGDGIAGDAEDARGLVELVEAVEIEQGARGDLAGRGFSAVGRGGEGEGCAGARAEDAADKAFFAHGDADDVGGERADLRSVCRTARLSARVRAVETTLTKSGSKASMRLAA